MEQILVGNIFWRTWFAFYYLILRFGAYEIGNDCQNWEEEVSDSSGNNIDRLDDQ